MLRRSPLARRSALLWLLVPYVLYLGALPLVNRVHPTLLGLPFLLLWMVVATLLTPVAVWLAWRGDRRRWRGDGARWRGDPEPGNGGRESGSGGREPRRGDREPGSGDREPGSGGGAPLRGDRGRGRA